MAEVVVLGLACERRVGAAAVSVRLWGVVVSVPPVGQVVGADVSGLAS